MIDLDKAIAAAVRTGKVTFGAGEAERSARTGRGRLIVVASNTLSQIKSDLKYYGKLARIPVVTYNGTGLDLGMACGKKFAVSALTVREPGDSDILKRAEKPQEDQEVTA